MNVVDKYWQKMPKKPKRRSIASTSNGNRKGSVSLDNLNLLLIKELLDDAEVKSADMAATKAGNAPEFGWLCGSNNRF